jgi:hypothetical protein
MKTVSDFLPVLGEPIRADRRLVEELAREWEITLPQDFIDIAGAFGDASISGFIYFFGGGTLQEYAGLMGDLMEQCREVPHPVLPSLGGALLWGNTLEGDQLFLVPHADGTWTVSAFLRQWGEWYDSELGFSDWLYGALTGEVATQWLPEWNPLPHPLKF